MAKANRRFGLFTVAIVAGAATAALTVAALAYQPDLGGADIALSIGTPPPMATPSPDRRADRASTDQLTVFLQRWTSTADGGH